MADTDAASHGAHTQPSPSVEPTGASSSSSSSAGVPPSVFPLARINRIVKCDESVGMLSKEATYAIAMATELFVKYFAQEGYTRARLDGRKTVQMKDLTRAIDEKDDLMFLMEAIPKAVPLSKALERRKELAEEGVFDPETLRMEAGEAEADDDEEHEDAEEEHDEAGDEEQEDDHEEAPKGNKGGRKSGASSNGKAKGKKGATAAVAASSKMDVDDEDQD